MNTVPGQFCTYTKVRDREDGVIAVMHMNEGANARLCASAPDLLEALSNIFGHAERTDAADLAELWGRMNDIRDLARTAIAKAKGGAK